MRAVGIFFKILFYLLILLVIAAVGGFFWLSHYVQTPEFTARVRESLRTTLGTDVQFEQITLNITKGLEVSRIRIPNPKSTVEPVLLEAQKLQLGYSLAALFDKEFQIANLRVVQPVIAIQQSASSGFILPFVFAEKAANQTTTPLVPEGWKLSVKSIEFKEATLRLKSITGDPVLDLTGLELLASLNSVFPLPTGSGTVRIEKAVVSGFTISSVNSSVVIGNNALNLPNLGATFYQGQLNGSFEMSMTGPAYPYNLKLDGNNIDINQMLAAIGQSSILSGKLSVKTSWRGPLDAPTSLIGKGTAEIVNGQLINVPLLKQIGQIPGLGQLSQPDFSQISSSFDIANQSILLSSLLIKSALAELSGTGNITFAKQLDLQMRLALSPELTRQLPPVAEERLSRRVDGFREVAFNVKGTAQNPETDLPQKLLLGNLNLPTTPEGVIDTVKEAAKDPLKVLKGIYGLNPQTTPVPSPAPSQGPSPTPVPLP